MSDFQLPPPPVIGEELRNVVSCAVTGCTSRGYGVRELDDDGGARVAAPAGWGEIEWVRPSDGTLLVLYVCSPACERRAVIGLSSLRA